MKFFNAFVWCGFALMAVGCGSVQKAELAAGDDVDKAVAEVNQIMQRVMQEQIDLLAYDEYKDGKRFLAKANRALNEGFKPEITLDNAATAKAYLNAAETAATPRKNFSDRILAARQSALNAGLRSSADLVEGLEEADDDLRDDTDMFSEPLTPEDFSKFQKKYLNLEIKAVQYRELNDVEIRIQQAVKQDAKELAAETLNTAQLDFADARNIIEQSPRNPDLYRQGVNKSVESSVLLADVMQVVLNAEGTPETIALQIVDQNRKLSSLSVKAGELEANLKSTQSSLMAKESALQESETMLREKDITLLQQQEELQMASTQVRFQRAMDAARAQFPESDALVYQQGTNMVFRLKRINFRSGSAMVPESSKSLLMKVNEIIRELQAENVVVQGHTDSVGSDELNKNLSSLRAKSVAKYLLSLRGGYPVSFIGYGETRPIASNETAQGRAINRRVDLVVSARK